MGETAQCVINCLIYVGSIASVGIQAIAAANLCQVLNHLRQNVPNLECERDIAIGLKL